MICRSFRPAGPPDLGPGRLFNPRKLRGSAAAAAAEAGVVRPPGQDAAAAAEQQLRSLALQQQQQQHEQQMATGEVGQRLPACLLPECPKSVGAGGIWLGRGMVKEQKRLRARRAGKQPELQAAVPVPQCA